MELVHLKFEPRFGPLVQDGRKQQTMRRFDAGERIPEIGDLAVCAAKVNRHQVQWLANFQLDELLPVQVDIHSMTIQIAGYRLQTIEEREQFAIDDGFTCLADMKQWLRQKYPDLLVYQGWLLGWTFSQGCVNDHHHA